ncbi:MAG: hypothetical protein U0793_27920 [Gemmataceae bacterium]
MLPVIATLTTFACSLAFALVPEPSAEEIERNRRKLEELERNPERLAQLRRHAQAFQALAKERQEQLLKLDHELRRLSAAGQTRLVDILRRYDEWLETLDPKERQRIAEAPDRKTRLAILHELRDRDWLQRQPRALREQYAKLDAKAQPAFLAQRRKDELRTKREWVVAARFWSELQKGTSLPARLTDLQPDVQTYVDEVLKRFVTEEEWNRLITAQGEWPRFPILLVKLADKYPPALPGPRGPTRWSELPANVQKLFKKAPKFAKAAEGKWPQFGKAVALAAENRGGGEKGLLPNELWPYNEKGLSREMQDFYKNKLWPALTEDEKKRMNEEVTHRWPDYPLAIQALAKAHHMKPPWFALPGPRDKWDRYRFETVAE